MKHSPNEREASVPWSVVLEGIDNLRLGLSEFPLDREDSREDEYATHQTDDIVHDRSGTTKFDGTLVPLHKGGVSEKSTKSSTL